MKGEESTYQMQKNCLTNPITIGLAVLFAVSLLPTLTHAQELTYEFSGKIIEQPTYYSLKDDYLLNPNSEILDFSPWKNRFYGDINFNLDYRNLKFISKLRPTVLSDKNGTDIETIVDDGYLDMGFKDKFFLYLGKKNVRDGVGLGANPTDFLGEGKEVDMTKREEERRVEREGNYLIGMDTYFKDITLTAIFTPRIKDLQSEKDRVVLKAGFLLEPLNTDISLHYFNGDIPGIGFNLSHTANDNLVLYTETAFRKGSNKKIVRLISEVSPNSYSIEEMDGRKVFAYVVTGGHYTFKNGTNIICEYIYNGDGYNQRNWDGFEGFVTYNNDQFKQGLFLDSATGNLSKANQLVTFGQMRRNYFFTRISNPSIFNKIDGALVLFVNLDDSSFLVNPSLDYKIKQDSTVGISSNIFVGGKTKEFGMIHWGEDVTLIYKHYF